MFPKKNELKRNISKTLGGALHTPSQNKKQIFSRQTHVLKERGNIRCPKQNKK